MNKYCLYRMFDTDGQLLYVGQSTRLAQRITEHKQSKSWWPPARIEVTQYVNKEELDAAEKQAIIDENPIHNIRHKKSDDKPLDIRVAESIVSIVEALPANNPIDAAIASKLMTAAKYLSTDLELRQENKDLPLLLNMNDASRYLSLSISTLTELIKTKKLKCIYIKGRRYIHRESIEKYVESLQQSHD